MFCVHCGKSIAEGMKFCGNCGNRVGNVTPKSRFLDNKCASCTAQLKRLTPGHYLCEYCGSEYFTDEAGQVTQQKLTEKEILDAMYRAARYERQNDPRRELQTLLDAVERAPDNVLLLVKLGRAYRRNNLYAKAVEQYEKALQYNPNYAGAYVNLGAVHILTQNYPQAEDFLRKGIRLMEQNRMDYTGDDYAVAYSNCAIAVGKQGRLPEAKQLLKTAEDNGYKNGDAARKMIGIRKGLFG